MIEEIKICYTCRNAVYENNLDFYDIRCEYDGKIHDENAGCEEHQYNPNYSKVNPRL